MELSIADLPQCPSVGCLIWTKFVSIAAPSLLQQSTALAVETIDNGANRTIAANQKVITALSEGFTTNPEHDAKNKQVDLL
ncbi:MAG: hypothetical protein R2857_13515 [Vampirovibrionales bacterium]